MDNVNNLNGVPNFGHGVEVKKDVIPTDTSDSAIDDSSIPVETEASKETKKKVRKSKVRSAAQKTFGGRY